MVEQEVQSGNLSPTDELFTMADAIRDDGYYDVRITDWKKVGEKIGNPSKNKAVVSFQTPTAGIQKCTYDWPTKPTEDNQFVQVLMVALGLDDPVKAVSQADTLKSPQEEHMEATVPCNATNGEWALKTSAADMNQPEESDNTDYIQSTILFAAGVILAPMFLLMDMHIWFTGAPIPDKVPSLVGQQIGILLYAVILTVLLL